MQNAAAKISFKSCIQGAAWVLITLFCTDLVHARVFTPETSSIAAHGAVAISDLPAQAQRMLALIDSGGPFPFEKDGVVFGNRERLLPAAKRGYYREYTVKTPRARNRGAKRIVCGGYQVQTPDICYYSEDHYASFRKIAR